MADAPVEVKVKGIKQLEQGARRLFDNIETAEPRDAIRPTVDQVVQSVRSRVPVKSGALRASVTGFMVGNIGRASMGAGLPYARWIEFGGGGRPYKPRGRFMYPTAKRTERAFRKHAELVCSQQIGRMSWPTPK
jgi:Bacteriophage HK97-gp10, putative tail-component